VCGFPVEEIPAVPVEDEEPVHMQRRITALLAPADAAHNTASRRMLGDLAALAHVARKQGTLALVEEMEDAVARAVQAARGQSFHPDLAWVLENGSPAAISALVRIVGRAVLAEDSVAGAAWLVQRCQEHTPTWPLPRWAGLHEADHQRVVALLLSGEAEADRRRPEA
jgi:hypothetical protein